MDTRTRSNPFPGVRPFMQEEADLFFGRDRQSDELVRRLAARRFLAVVGTSGSGKSSLVRAGLLPSLEGGFMAGAGAHWRIAILRPQDDPVGFLARAIVETGMLAHLNLDDAATDGIVETTLRRSSLGLVEAARLARLAPHESLLILVDQFEELFRFADLAKQRDAGDEAPAFVKLLLEAAQQTEVPVYVVITMRSDFLGDCARFRGLPEAVSDSQYLIPRLTRDELRAVITGPIGVRGGGVSPSLVQHLLNAIGDDMDQLPVLQHALMRAWDHWEATNPRPPMIELSDLEAIGGMAEALSRHAEEAFKALPTEQDRKIAERLFKCLTERGPDNRDVRRPMKLSRIAAIASTQAADVVSVIDVFRTPERSFLMPAHDISLKGEDDLAIDISHESLIRQWQRLRGWVEEEADSRTKLLRVVEAARVNQTSGDSLWRGHELETALEWRQNAKPTFAWVGLYTDDEGVAAWQLAKSFLDVSAEQVRRDIRRRKLMINALGFLTLAVVVVSLIAAVVGFNLELKAKSRDLANEALAAIDQDPARSAYLALAAVDQDGKNPLAIYALRQALATLEVAHTEKILDFDAPVSDAAYSSDGTLLLTASGKTVSIFDSKSFTKVREIARDNIVQRAWLIDKNNILVTQTNDGRAQIQKIDDSTVRTVFCPAPDSQAYTVSVSPNEHGVALGCSDGSVLVWDPADPAAGPSAYQHRANESVTALAFSSDNIYLASGDVAGSVNVWKLGDPNVWIRESAGSKDTPIKHTKAIRDVGFGRGDSTLLVTAGDDNQAIVWRLDMVGRRLMKDEISNRFPLKHDRPVTAAKFATSREDTAPVITVSGKNAQLWINPDVDPKQIRAHDDWINDANVSSDGELLVTASNDSTARIWSTRSGAPIAVLRGHRAQVNRAMFSPDGDQLVTASEDGSVRVWRFRAPRLLASLGVWVNGAAFEPNGTRIAVGGERKGYLLESNETVGNALPASRDLPASTADQLAFLSWSRDREFVVGLQVSNDVFQRRSPLVWNIKSGNDTTPTWLKEWLFAVFSPGTDELVTIGGEGQVAVWDTKSLSLEDPTPALTFGKEPGRWIAAMSPDGKWIATANGKTVDLLKREDQAHPQELSGHKGDIMSLQFSRDGKWLLTASKDRTARIWSIDHIGQWRELAGGHTAALIWASFDPAGKRVVTASADSSVRVWDVESTQELAALHWHGEGVNSVEFSPDGKWILSASDDGTVKLGECEACMLGIRELKERVPEFAKLPKAELDEIDRDARTATRYLPAFLSRQH